MKYYWLLILLFYSASCNTNTSASKEANDSPSVIVGGGCEGCELMYEGMPNTLKSIDTLPDWHQEGERMEISGTVYKQDGKTPAPDVIIYLYHTDSKGYYSVSPDQRIGMRHGHIRGWVKTDQQGRYKVYTNKPAPYPGANIPAHIHPIIKEPGLNEYYIDEFEFEDDSLVTHNWEIKREKRGGSGIVQLSRNKDGLLICHRDIMLGLNIPDYKSH